MEAIKIPMHSVIDLITNSSTEIFVYSENSLEPAKELINEILKLQGVDQTCDDLFELSVEMSDYGLEQYLEYEQYDQDDLDVEETKKQIEAGNIPDWFEKYHVETFLVIKPKDEKYAKLAELLKKFLYSSEHEEHMWG
jgi:hypothetical protein